MKINDILKFLKIKRFCDVFPVDGTQWFSNGEAAFPLYNFPAVDEKAVKALLSLNDDEARTWNIFIENRKLSGYDFKEADFSADEIVEAGEISLKAGGRIYTPFVTSRGMIFIKPEYLAPFRKDKDAEYKYFVRYMKSGQPYLLATKGFVIEGIIMPVAVINREFIDLMTDYLAAIRISMINGITGFPDLDDPYQIRMDGGGGDADNDI